MKCVLKFKQDGEIVEEVAELEIGDDAPPSKLVEAGQKFLKPRNNGRPSWNPKVTLLSVKPSSMRLPGPSNVGGWRT